MSSEMELPPDEPLSNKARSDTEKKLDLLFLLLVDEHVWDLGLYPEPDRAYRILRKAFQRLGIDFTIDGEVREAFDILWEHGGRNILGRRIWETLDALQTEYHQLEKRFEGIGDLRERLTVFEENQKSLLAHQREQTEFTLTISNNILEISKNNAEMSNNYSKIADNYSRLTTDHVNLNKLVNDMKVNLDKVLTDYASLKDTR